MKLLSHRVRNNEISVKFAHTTIHQDFAVTLMNTPGYFCAVLILLIPTITSSENYIHLLHMQIHFNRHHARSLEKYFKFWIWN